MTEHGWLGRNVRDGMYQCSGPRAYTGHPVPLQPNGAQESAETVPCKEVHYPWKLMRAFGILGVYGTY